MSNSENYSPPVSFVFQLSIAKETDSNKFNFQEASGISMEMNIEEIGSGGENRFKYRLPGVNKYNNLVLKRGLVPINSTIYSWVMKTLSLGLSNPIETKDISVALIDAKNEKVASWDFINAYPVKWDMSNLNSMENEVVVETLEFAYNYYKKN